MQMDTEKRKRVIAVIPCLNEERFIPHIVSLATKYVDEVIVVDDGSEDDTAAAAEKAGAVVFKHPHRMGAGAGTKTGIQEALEHGADIIVTLDGDGQHDPNEIPGLIQPIIDGRCDVVIGSRFLRPAAVARYRKFGIDVITWSYNLGCREKVADAQSGFRAYSRKAAESLHITYPGFGFSIQTLVQARKQGFRIAEQPVSCIYHDAGSTLNPIVHGLNVLWSVIKIRLQEEIFNRSRTGQT